LKLNYVTLAVITVCVAIFLRHALEPPWTVQRIMGLSLAIPSFLLLVIARIQLGRAFSVRARASTLVTTGIYSRIRNPIYFFSTLTLAGIVIWSSRLWLLLGFIVLIPLQTYRSRNEERVLSEKFGASYLEYKRKTWF
jgi:protein-S-isoprenylcysteine O-methyltransferase Ste14